MMVGRFFFTFCENQSGGRPDSEKGFIARLTDTLEEYHRNKVMNIVKIK